MTTEQKLLAACVGYRAKLDKLEAENAALRAALTVGQENCNEEYDRLRKERDANKTALAATRSQLAALRIERNRYRVVLQDIADAAGFDNIGNWARNKARATLEKEAQP